MRNYQQKIIDDVYAQWQTTQNVCVQLSTGGGKTHIFCKIIADHPGHSIVIAHRNELLTQISLTLALRGVRHTFIGQKQIIKDSISLHLSECQKSFYDPNARVTVVGVDTLIRMSARDFNNISLVVQDEAHHVLKENKWGQVAQMFPTAKGLYPTATPLRADGKGLGRHADGLFDGLVLGPPMRYLINEQFLTDYRIFMPPSDLDLSTVPLAAGGDYSPKSLSAAVSKSHIIGDIVEHYLRLAEGKRGVTFAVDIKAAENIAEAYRNAGVLAEVVSSNTPALLRADIMRRFRSGEIHQLVNVDILGEGVDVPAIEVVSMARPTQSYTLYAQQFGRALRPLAGKTHAIIIDHVSNITRHGLPDDMNRSWTLDRRERRTRGKPSVTEPIRTCLSCFCVYSKMLFVCPQCGKEWEPVSRSNPTLVDGDLTELDADALARLRGEIVANEIPYKIPLNADIATMKRLKKLSDEKRKMLEQLRDKIAWWAGLCKAKGKTDSQIYQRFYQLCGMDIMTAQTLEALEMFDVANKIRIDIDTRGYLK